MNSDNLGNVVTESYANFGREVNTNRMISHISDGCKTVYKRVILSALSYPKDKFIKTATLVGECLKHHPHGDSSVSSVITELVKMGIIEGKGNFGYTTMTESYGAAATRYTHCRLNPNFRDMIEPLLPYVRKSVGEGEEGELEHDYIPTCFPISFIKGTVGMGLGCVSKYPSWTAKSMIIATAKDNPELLVPTNGLKVSKEDRINFWNNSKGSITYKFDWVKDSSANGWYITGNPIICKPNIKKLRDLQSDGRLIIRDESHGDSFKLFIGIPKRIQVDHILIENQIKKACEIKTSYDLWAVYGTVTRPATGKYWCNYCFNNYQRLCELYKKDKLEKLKIDLEAYINFKQIADLIINKPSMTYEQIKTQLKLTSISVVNKVGSMSVGSMRTTDGQQKAKSTQEKIDYFEKFTYKDLINPYLKSK